MEENLPKTYKMVNRISPNEKLVLLILWILSAQQIHACGCSYGNDRSWLRMVYFSIWSDVHTYRKCMQNERLGLIILPHQDHDQTVLHLQIWRPLIRWLQSSTQCDHWAIINLCVDAFLIHLSTLPFSSHRTNLGNFQATQLQTLARSWTQRVCCIRGANWVGQEAQPELSVGRGEPGYISWGHCGKKNKKKENLWLRGERGSSWKLLRFPLIWMSFLKLQRGHGYNFHPLLMPRGYGRNG